MSKKKSPFTNSPKAQSPISPTYKTSINFFQSKRMDSQPQQQVPQFNSSFYKVDSATRNNETRMTKRLVEKMSGHKSREKKEGGKSRFVQDEIYKQNSPPHEQPKDQIVQHEDNKQPQQLVQNLGTPPKPSHSQSHQQQQSSLEEYISLILKNVPNVDEFLYLVRHKTQQSLPQQDNIYQLEIIDYQQIKQKDKDSNFQYYTISKKGFCHYYGGKPIEFIDLKQWLQEKQIYQKIKKLKFFSRFRRWKTIKMWIKKVVRHRIQKCSLALEDKLFILNPTIRSCILEINSINLEMQKSLCIISKNQASYTLQSFKHCQQKTRRQSASIVEQFSRRSRQSVRKCFDQNLQNLKELLKTRANYQDKNFAASTHNPKDNAFQVLGFPAKMSYEHRSKLRKLTGRFVRLSYLIDFIHLNGLAGIFKTQIQSFSSKLNKLQIESEAEVICTKQRNKSLLDESDKQKMFSIQLIFKPYQISQAHINEIPLQTFDISMKIQRASELFNPLYHIKEKVPQIKQDPSTHSKLHLIKQESVMQTQYRKYIPSICDLWLSMKPTLDNIFDQLSFLIKQSMASLKYFERWSKHREMQKYINILEQWDDIVSENWQVCENDNLDPISIIQNLQSSMSRIKEMLQISQNKLTEKIVQNTTQALNIYWQNTQADVDQLLTNPNIENNAQTLEYYLAYMCQWIQKFQAKIPNFIQLGIFTVTLDKMKNQIIEFMKQTCESLKDKLPQYVEDNTNDLNIWLNEKSQLLREEIHNIDDFVKLNKSLKLIDQEFNHKKQLCNDLGLIYQTMYNYKIQSKKRKQFEVLTLKAKDQLQQLLIHVEQNIERKTQFFTRQVSRYHLPNLLKQIQKISDNIGSQQFQSLKSSSQNVIRKLVNIKTQYDSLKDKKAKCLQYLSVLKLSEVDVTELDELERQINARLQMWENLQIFNEFMRKIDSEIVSQMDLQALKQFVTQKRQIVKFIESVHNKPNNEVLRLLKSKVGKYFINLPLLQGFNDKLSESHWEQIGDIVKDYKHLDLRKKEFTLKQFLQTGIGKQAKRIEYIFNKAKVENELQVLYSQVQNVWGNTLVKSKAESKFVIISNPQVMRQAFDYMLRTLCGILSNPFSQTLRQYSLTYDTLIQHYNTFQHWLLTQQHLLKVDSMCKLLDIKKLPDYSQFENCQKIYKNVMKHFIGNRSVQNGVKMNKLFVIGVDDRLAQMDESLKKVQENIKFILQEHRKTYPPYYIFTDQQLFTIITTPGNHHTIESTALKLVPALSRLEFENQRITGIYNVDNQKLQRNTISTTLDVQQIIEQLSDTVGDNTRKSMRSCKYKAVQTSLIKLVPLFHCQYLLAINKTDFTNYTQISIDNQSHSPQSLKQFYKVMKKDIIQDLRLRTTIKQEFIPRYDTLILQSLYHQQVLGKMIKSNIKQTTDYQWQRLIRFYWDEGNNQDNNLTVKQCHAKLKYGNQYIGSRTKVVIESDTNLLFSLSQAESVMTTSSLYQLERVMNYIGQRLVIFQCCNFTQFQSITNFMISCWYWQTTSIFKNFDHLLDIKAKEEILTKKCFRQIKDNLLRKNLFNLKQSQKRQSAVFLSPSHQNHIHQYRGQYRVVTHEAMTHNHIKNLLRVKDVFETENQISLFLMKLFQILEYFQQKANVYNLSIEDFLQNQLKLTPTIKKNTVLEQFLCYIRPKVGNDTIGIIQQSVRLQLTSQSIYSDSKDQIMELGHSKLLTGDKSSIKQREKMATVGSKRSSSRPSQRQLINASKLAADNVTTATSKPTTSSFSSLTSTKPKAKLSKLPIIQQPSVQQLKQKQVDKALQYRRVIILTGVGMSKLHLIKKMYSSTYKIIEVFTELQSQHLNKQGIITHHVNRSVEKHNSQENLNKSSQKEQQRILFYFNGLNTQILNQLQCICHNTNYKEVRQRIQDNNILIVIATQKLPQIDFSVISWLYTINVQLQPQYLLQVGKQWSQRYLSQQSTSESDQQSLIFMKFYEQTLLGTFQNWSIKDIRQRQRNVYIFLTYLQSLLPVKKLLQAMVYCFIRLFSNLDADYIKLQFLVKKLIGQEKISEDEKVYDLIYYHGTKGQQQQQKQLKQQSLRKQQSQFQYNKKQPEPLQQLQVVILNREQGLISSKQFYQGYCQSLLTHNNQSQQSISSIYYHQNIVTSNNYHYSTIMNRILTNTDAGIYLSGPTNSGKSTLYQLYKHFNYNNKSFLKLTMLDCTVNNEQFVQKILNNVNVWSLKQIKAKVNFNRSVIMVDDISMPLMQGSNYDTVQSKHHIRGQKNQNTNKNNNKNNKGLIVKSNLQKITLIKQLLQYKLLQYPSTYYPSAFHTKLMQLSHIDFILSGHQQLQSFQQCTIPLQLTLHESQLKTIFNQYLRKRLNYFQINDLSIADIVSTTYDVCKKLSAKNTEFDGLQLVSTKNILGKFMLLKIKDLSGNIIKQVQKYWVYLLQQHLALYDIKHNNIKNLTDSQYSIKTNTNKIQKTTTNNNNNNNKPLQVLPYIRQKSIIYKQLKNLNLQQIKPSTLCYSFLHTRSSPQSISTNQYSKRVQFVKDIKKIFNVINQKIEKYNQSDNKRYGNVFQYVHFDQLVKKVVKMTNNLISKDYLLYGRKGSGKESIVKLVAYLQGSNYKPITNQQDSIPSSTLSSSVTLKQTVSEIFLNSNVTTMSSFIISKQLSKQRDIQQLKQYYYCDFQNQILNNKQLDKPQKVYIKEKEKQRQMQKQRQRQQKMLYMSTNSRMQQPQQMQRTLGNINVGFGSQQYYIAPRQKLSQQDVIRYKQAIRVVILTSDKQLITKLPTKIKQQLMIDQLQQIPIASVQQYTVKFLQAQEIKSATTPKVSLLLAQIWNFAKEELHLTLRDYDDTIRLYCSFIDTLTDEIKQELKKFARVIDLYNHLRKLNESLNQQLQRLHAQIKLIAEDIIKQQTEQKKQQKHLIEEEMHKKSAYVNKTQKIIQMFDLLIPYFKQKHSLIQKYVMDRDYFQESLAVAASYFTYMSEMSLKERRQILQKWYVNSDKIPLLQSSEPIESFLTMFNLYPQEFNTQPIDDLGDFYENMAIVFNSVKPVFIRDSSHRGKHWLQNVCSFVCVSQKESNFVQVICENLTKPSNILIQISSQQTMNNLSSSFIHGLLFLSDSTESINIKGQQYKVSPQAKFYVLLNQCVELSEEKRQQFTIVEFSSSMQLLQKQLEYAMMSSCHPDVFYSQLQMRKKIRNLKLQRQALMLEIAENVYVAYQAVVGNDQIGDGQSDGLQQQQKNKKEQTNKKVISSSKDKVKDQLKQKQKQKQDSKKSTSQQQKRVKQVSNQQLQQFISQLTDKTLTRGQNLSNKLKQKGQLCKQIQSKLSFTNKFTTQIRQFVQTCTKCYNILSFMTDNSLKAHNNLFSYCRISHSQFVKRITLGLRKKFIKVEKIQTVLLFCVKMWGDQYVDTDFYVYIMAILGLHAQILHYKQFGNQEKYQHQKNQKIHQKIHESEKNESEKKDKLQQYQKKHKQQQQQIISNITLTPTLQQTLKSSTNYQQLKQQLNQQFSQFLSTFTHDLLIPYFQHTGTINNLHEDQPRRVTLNNIWVKNENGVSQRFAAQQRLQQNLKIVKLQIKSMQNIQHQIKKYIFEQNILMISSMQLLQSTLQHLVKLGSHQKIIYFNCVMSQQSINRVVKLAKKYSVSQINHIYENKNILLGECLFRIQRERESRKLSSVSNIKSIKSIANIKYDDTSNNYTDNSNSNNGIQRLQQLNNPNNNEQQNQPQQQQQQQNLLFQQQQATSMKKTIRSEKNLLQIQKQHLQCHLPNIISHIYSILSHQYLKHNLIPPYISPLEIQIFTDYLTNCTFTEDQQFIFKDKVILLLQIMETFLKQNKQIIDQQITNQFKQLKTLVLQTLNTNNNNKNITQVQQKQQIQTLQAKLQQLSEQLEIQNQHIINKVHLKAKKVQFQNQYITYFRQFFPNIINKQESAMDINSLIIKARNIFDSLRNIDEPIAVKRNSRKSVNAIFRKEQLREKLLSAQVPSTTSANQSITNLQKKAAIKRVSKQSFLLSPTSQQQHQKAIQSLLKQEQAINLAPTVLQIEFKKLSSKIHFLTQIIQNAIKTIPNIKSIQLLLLLLQDNIPGTWLMVLQQQTFTITSLQNIFKKYIRQQQDMGYCLEKVKRNNHAEIDFTFIKFPKDYLQLHFNKKLTDKMSDFNGVFVLMNTPSNQELQNGEDHIKISAIQTTSWKFSPTEVNAIDITGSTDKPISSEAKLSPSCCFVKKDFSTINVSNLTPIDVYESRQSTKPFMKVYAVCKKMTSVGSSVTNNLSLYLKDSLWF